MIDAFDGDDGKAGERLKSAMDTFLHHGATDTAAAAKKLRDPFMTSLETMGRASGTPMLTEGAADRAAEAASPWAASLSLLPSSEAWSGALLGEAAYPVAVAAVVSAVGVVAFWATRSHTRAT